MKVSSAARISGGQKLAMFANGLAEKVGINISFVAEAHPACGKTRDGKMMVIMPSIPHDLPERDFLKFRGVVLHEVMHYLYTDFEIDRSGLPLQRHLENVFEDIRIERIGASKYPGGAKVLATTVRILVEERFFEGVPEDRDPTPPEALTGYLLTSMRAEILEQPIQSLAREWELAFKGLFPAEIIKGVEDIKSKAAHMVTTQDAFRLAKEVIELLKQYADDNQPKDQANQNDQGDGQDDQQDQSGQQGTDQCGQNNGQQQGQGQNGGESEAGDTDGDGAEGDGTSSDEAGDQSSQACQSDDQSQVDDQSSEQGDQQSAEVLKAVISALEAEEDDLQNADISRLMEETGHGNDGWGRLYCSISTVRYEETRLSTGTIDQLMVERAVRLAPGLGNQLKRLLRSKAPRVRHRAAYTGKRLHRNAGVYAATGVTAPAYQSRDVTGIDAGYDVHILVDYSSSMEDDRRIQNAIESCLSIAKALDNIPNVRVAVSGFTNTWVRDSRGETNHFLIKDYEESFHSLKKMTGFNPDALWGTPLVEGISGAISHMQMNESVRNRMLIVITDGEVNPDKELEATFEEAKASGIRTVGIGIQLESILQLPFDASTVIQNPQDLVGVLAGEIRRAIA